MTASIGMRSVLTAVEHQVIPVTADGAGFSITPDEANHLARVNELRRGFCTFGHRHVKLAQYCGIVSLSSRVLEILPKVGDADVSVEDCRGTLLRLLALSRRYRHFRHLDVGQHARRGPLLDVFIAAFFESVQRIVRGGLLRAYVEREQDLRTVRGRIAVSRQLSALGNRTDRVACSFDELSADNAWNRLLKKAIRATRPWIQPADLTRRWVELMEVFGEVDDARFARADGDRLSFDRKADRYREAVAWARLILALMAPSLRGGEISAPAFLFDMNRLFEHAVAEVLRDDLASDVTLSSQHHGTHLAKAVTARGTEPSCGLRPDLVWHHSTGRVHMIADTKWKNLPIDRTGRPVPAEADIYQMLAYAAAFRCDDLLLIYPWRQASPVVLETTFQLPEVGCLAPKVRVVGIDVERDGLPITFGASLFAAPGC